MATAGGDELIKHFKGLLEESQSKMLKQLDEKLEDSRNVVSAAVLSKLEGSMFAIIVDEPAPRTRSRQRQPEQHACAGFFFREPGVAATAGHCLPDSAKVGTACAGLIMLFG